MKAISSLAIGLIIGLVIGLAVGYVIVHKGVDKLQPPPTPTSTLTQATTPYPSPSLSLSPTPTPTPVEESKQTYRIEITVWSRWYGAISIVNSEDGYFEKFDINGTTKRQEGTTVTYKIEAGVEDTITVEAYCIGKLGDDRWIIVSIEEDQLFGETLCTVADEQEILFRYVIKTGEVKKGLY